MPCRDWTISGNPVLQVRLGDETVDLGLSRSNILCTSAPPQLAQRILVLRLRKELKIGGAPKVSEGDVSSDWELLQQVLLARCRNKGAIAARLTAFQSDSP
jgi:hypothetical protein